MRRTMFFYSKVIGSKIRRHHTLHIHFIQVCMEIKQSLCSSRHKLTLGNYLQCNRRNRPDRKPKPIPAQGNYPQGYLGQKASVTATLTSALWPFLSSSFIACNRLYPFFFFFFFFFFAGGGRGGELSYISYKDMCRPIGGVSFLLLLVL